MLHALQHGCKTIKVRTVDTDVVVILVASYNSMQATNPGVDIFVAFGMGKNYTVYNISTICHNIGMSKCQSLAIFHAFTGCDTTSAFKGKGKKSTWQAWNIFEEVTEAFLYLAQHPYEQLDVTSDCFRTIERFTVVLYDRNSDSSYVNETRKELFCQNGRAMEAIPPTQDALLQHCRRAIYQAGLWTTSSQSWQVVPSPGNYGWRRVDDSWQPLWINIPEVSEACYDLIKCSCKTDCSRCKCAKAGLQCTARCKCSCDK